MRRYTVRPHPLFEGRFMVKCNGEPIFSQLDEKDAHRLCKDLQDKENVKEIERMATD